jgi:hypothetical protein
MAIAPNTTFVSGAILTAAQMNALPWGIVAIGNVTSNTTFTTAEVVLVTSSSFTAVANRYYRITYQIPGIIGQTNEVEVGIRLTNATGTRYTKASNLTSAATAPTSFTAIVVTTLAAGTTTIVGTGISYAGTSTLQASATSPVQLIVEDIGPA